MLRILIAGLAGGIAMYVWSSIAHVVTPLGSMGISALPDEPAVTSVLKTQLAGKPGFYMFPAAAMEGGSAPGPSGLVVYEDAFRGMGAATLGGEALVEILEALVAAVLLSVTLLTRYWSRVGFVGLVGLAAVLATNPSFAIWYGFPWSFTLANMAMDLIGYVVAGLVIAAILKPRTAVVA